MSGVIVEATGPALVIRIDRPEAMNALDIESMKAIRAALEQLERSDDHQVGILTGTGTRAFCSGSDLKRTFPPDTSFASAYFGTFEASIDNGLYVRAIALDSLRLTKPLIAAVNGHCLAGGMELALAADLRIAAPSATFGLPEPKVGSMPALGGIALLSRTIPAAVANKMLLTGDRIDAAEAYRVGLVSDLVEHEELLPTAIKLAERICENGPLAVKAIKAAARQSHDMPLTQAMRQEELYWGVLRDTADRIEGRTAFAEKRRPKWTGA